MYEKFRIRQIDLHRSIYKIRKIQKSFDLFSERFGIHWVNFTHPDRPRIPKKSATELKKIFSENGFPSGASTAAFSSFTCIFAFIGLVYAYLL